MSYVVIGEKIVHSEEILKIIQEKFNFKKVRDLTKGSKRDDTIVYQVIHDANQLREEILLEGPGVEMDKEELVEELMSIADEHTSLIEDLMPEDTLSYVYSYHYDEGSEEIKTIFLSVDEAVGELRLKDISERILRSVD